MTVQVANPLPECVTSITNTAAVADDGANGPDPTPGNNTATDTDSVTAGADLTVTKDDGIPSALVPTVRPGDQLTYTLVVTNVGAQTADGVLVTDTLPPNTTFVDAPGGVFDGVGTVTWTLGTLAAGAVVRSP